MPMLWLTLTRRKKRRRKRRGGLELCQLQLCNWHPVNIAREEGESWVQADTLEEQRDKLLKELDTKGRDYLTGYYGPKEP